MKKLFLGISFFLLFTLFSCETIFEPDTSYTEPKVVANVLFSNKGLGEILLSSTTPVNSNNTFETLRYAQVTIFKENEIISEFESDKYQPEKNDIIEHINSGNNYSIEINNHPFLKDANASDQMPEKVTIKDHSVLLDQEITELELDVVDAHVVTIKFDDIPNQKNYYHIRAYEKFKTFPDDDEESIVYVPFRTLNPAVPIGFRDRTGLFPELIFNDESFENQSFEIKLYISLNELNTVQSGDIVIELRNVSEAYYDYFTTLIVNFKGNNLMNHNIIDPVEVYNNIENGYGIFAAYYADEIMVSLN